MSSYASHCHRILYYKHYKENKKPNYEILYNIFYQSCLYSYESWLDDIFLSSIEPSSQNQEGYAILDAFVGMYKCPPEHRYILSAILLYITTTFLRNCWQCCSITRLESATLQKTLKASLFETLLQTFFLSHSNILVPLVLVRRRISLTLHVCSVNDENKISGY